MNKQSVLLEEYSKKPEILSFTNEKDALAFYDEILGVSTYWKKKLNLSFSPFEAIKNNLEVHLYAKGVTGFIKLNGFFIEIIPKFLSRRANDNKWRVALTRTLLYINQEKFFDNKFTNAKQTDAFLPDLMAESFLYSLEQGIYIGLPRSYAEKREMLPFYRGAYDTSQYVNHLLKPNLIPCKYDEYSYDNIINQVLKAAAIELSKTVYSTKLAVQLSELATSIDAQYQIPSIVQIENAFLPPQYSYLKNALEIAKLIFQNKSLENNIGDLEQSGFLWDSATIFEDLVKLVIKIYCFNSKLYKFTDAPITFLQLANRENKGRELGKIDTYPDIRILQDTKTKFLLDAKYKVWTRQPKNADLYQVIAGSRAAYCKLGGLVYPLPEDREVGSYLYNVEGEGFPKVISVIFIDVLKLSENEGLKKIVKKLEEDIDVLNQCG